MRKFVLGVLMVVFLAGCAGAPMTPTGAPVETLTEIAGLPTEMGTPAIEATPTLVQGLIPEITAETSTETVTPFPTETATPEPTPTETIVPPMELPTEAPNAPLLLYWYGNPTYTGDSLPDYVYRITYNPDMWVPATDQWGEAVLAHRNIDYCTLSPTIGRGLSPEYTVEQDSRTVGALTFDIARVYRDGVLAFVTYTGGDSRIATAFQINFVDNSDQCVADAESLLATLISISIQMTPAAP